MCNMPDSPNREDIERYWTQPTHYEAIPCPIKGVEFPQDGKAGYVVVEFEDLVTFKECHVLLPHQCKVPGPRLPERPPNSHPRFGGL